MIDKDLKAESSKRKRAAWRDPAHLTALAALVASIVPFTAAVNGYFNVQLEHEKYLSELRLKYIERVLDANRDPAARESFLRFMVGTMDSSDKLYIWAQNELANSAEIKRLRVEFDKINAKFKQTTYLLEKERNASNGEEMRELQRILSSVNKERTKLEEALKVAELKGYAEDAPSLGQWWVYGKSAVQSCKQHGSEFLESAGLKPAVFSNSLGDIHITGVGKASSVYVTCSEQRSIVILAVASYRKSDDVHAISSPLLSRFISSNVR